MYIVLPGAWPDPEVATDLAEQLTRTAPTLAHWLTLATVHVQKSPAWETWCTPLEHWQLQSRGFSPAQGEHISAGLGPLRTTTHDDQPVWLAELVHMSPSRDGAALLPGATLEITPEDSQALLEDAQQQVQDSGISLEADSTEAWRVRWAQPMTLPCASPALVAVSSVNDWWPQDLAARPWRRLVNALQMAWYDHPVNQRRAQLGLPPINSLWLYGGAQPGQLALPEPTGVHVEPALQSFATRQDWGGWLQALAQLEQSLSGTQSSGDLTLVLTGRDRYAVLTVRRNWWARWHKQDWRRWWCAR